MITRIEIDGFKTFQDFAVDLAPFQVIIGPNGCGKSNFFDALDLLSKLANSDLRTAFKGIRGNINELFTVLPNGKNVDRMRFSVEMLVKHPQEEISIKYLRMRYEIEIRRRTDLEEFEQLYVYEEHLASLSTLDGLWMRNISSHKDEISLEDITTEWITTKHETADMWDASMDFARFTPDNIVFYSNELGRDLAFASRSMISAYFEAFSPHLRTAQAELKSLRLLRLDTAKLRQPNDLFDDKTITSIGENLPATLARMEKQDKRLLKSVSRDVSNIVPNFAQIEVKPDRNRKQIALYAHTRDKRRFSIDALSEGTLRILALATLRNDPQLRGTICFEYPEMGVHPGALEHIVRLLRGMATDLNDPEDLKLPLRQVLVTTHSPELVSHLNIEQGELLFVTTPTRVMPGGDAWQVTRFTSVCADNKQGPDQTYALSNVIEYLNNPDAAAKRERLRETMRR